MSTQLDKIRKIIKEEILAELGEMEMSSSQQRQSEAPVVDAVQDGAGVTLDQPEPVAKGTTISGYSLLASHLITLCCNKNDPEEIVVGMRDFVSKNQNKIGIVDAKDFANHVNNRLKTTQARINEVIPMMERVGLVSNK